MSTEPAAPHAHEAQHMHIAVGSYDRALYGYDRVSQGNSMKFDNGHLFKSVPAYHQLIAVHQVSNLEHTLH